MAKKLWLIFLTLISFGFKLNPMVIKPKRKTGLSLCYECSGDGKIKNSHCPVCDGSGILNLKEDGEYETYSMEFVRGYKDYHKKKPYEAPYYLKVRAKKWEKGWLEAEKAYESV